MNQNEINKRHKICKNCGIEYCDLTKRYAGSSCSNECYHKLGVKTRHEKGSYIKTLEHSNKIIASLKKTISEIKNKKEHYSKINEKRKQTYISKLGVEHWTQTNEAKLLLSAQLTNRIVSDETRKKQSLAAQARVKRSEVMYSFGKKGKRKDLNNKFFRSTWEANFARILNFLNLNWEYEKETFQLKDNFSYTPDFLIENNVYVEIKGYMNPIAKNKIDLFKLIYPNINLIIIGKNEYKILKECYHVKLKEWE